MKYVNLRQIIEEMNLRTIYESSDLDDIRIYSSEISRPGLQIVGFFENFVPERLHIIGKAEFEYLKRLSADTRYKSIELFFKYPISSLIISRDLPVFPEIIELAKRYDRTIIASKETTSQLINRIINYLDMKLAAETRLHGVLVEVYGVGVLISGKSGVGKSETALDLVIRGHRLISDDIVIIKKLEETLIGESPKLTRHFMEIRGLGILDIERLYGVGSIKNHANINLVTELEIWDRNKEYDRLGLDENFTEILGIKVPIVTIPVRPGRNVAMIIEVATRNFRQKALGYNAAEELNKRIIEEDRKKRGKN